MRYSWVAKKERAGESRESYQRIGFLERGGQGYGLATRELADQALELAYGVRKELRESTRWRRIQWLKDLYQGVLDHREELIESIIEEAGKPRRFAEGELERALQTIESGIWAIQALKGQEVVLDAWEKGQDRWALESWEARGVVVAITPFNFPLNLVLHKLVPALAVGAPVILKPSSQTPGASWILGKICSQMDDLPEGAVSVLLLRGSELKPWLEKKEIEHLTFTGSVEVGWELKRSYPLKHVTLELGGSAPMIVMKDAKWQEELASMVVAAFAYSGQVCISLQRIFVEREIFDRFKELFVEQVQQLKSLPLTDSEALLSPMIDEKALSKVSDWVEEAKVLGGTVLCGGERGKEGFYLPTVLTGVPQEAKVACQEVFGPVVVLEPFDEVKEAFLRANQGACGLQASLWTESLSLARQAFGELRYANVLINSTPTFRVDSMPYGGMKPAGWGREGVLYAMKEMCELRLWTMPK